MTEASASVVVSPTARHRGRRSAVRVDPGAYTAPPRLGDQVADIAVRQTGLEEPVMRAMSRPVVGRSVAGGCHGAIQRIQPNRETTVPSARRTPARGQGDGTLKQRIGHFVAWSATGIRR